MTDATTNGAPRQVPDRVDPGVGQAVIWHMVRKNWVTAVVATLLVTLGVTFYTLSQTKIYQAAATIQFDPNPPKPLGAKVETVVDMGAGNYWDNHEYYETQYKIIQSMRVSKIVAAELGLHRDIGFIMNLPKGAKLPAMEATEDMAAGSLRSRLRVEPIKDSRLAVVKLEDADPERAQRVLTAVINAYVQMNQDDARASTSDAVDWLGKQLDKLKRELEESELSLHKYKETKNILSVSMDDQSNMLREEMKQLNDVLTQVRTKREEVASRRDQLAKVQQQNPTNLPASELLKSPTLQELRRSYDEGVRERDALLQSGMGKNHPDVRKAQARIDTARDAILVEVRNIQGALDGDLAAMKRQESGLAGLFEAARKEAFELNLLEIEYNRLKRAKENNEKLYALVLERTKESDLTRMLTVNNIRIVDPALRPGTPVRPQVALNITTGLFVGVLIGIVAAMGRAMLDRSMKTPDDVEKEVGLTFIGLLPEVHEEDKRSPRYGRNNRRDRKLPPKLNPDLIVHEFPMSGVAEAARAVRTNLLFMAPDQPFRTLLVTSASPSEGKTMVASCIAIAMAQADHRVLLIDCDLRRPRVHRVFGKRGGGVSGLLVGEELNRRVQANGGVCNKEMMDDLVDKIVIKTDVPNLFAITAGATPPNPAELLHSERFKAFLACVASRFDRVILDSPPVVPVTDAAILSTLVDGTVLVIRAFKTTKDLARHALRTLLDVGANVAGAVLNSVNLNKSEYKYSHYYYYRKSGYYSEETGPSSEERPSVPSPEPGHERDEEEQQPPAA